MSGRGGEKRCSWGLHGVAVTRARALRRVAQGGARSGISTGGHVGPEALSNLLDVALPGAVFALSINLRVWTGAGFDRALQALADQGRIADLYLIEVQVYGAAAAQVDADHAGDRAAIAVFRAA